MSSRTRKIRAAAETAALQPAASSVTKSLAWLSLGWACWIIYSYWNHFTWLSTFPTLPPLSSAPTQWIVFWWDIKALLLATTVLAGATAAGSYVLRLFELPWNSPLEELVFSTGLGLAATGYLVFGLGLLQLYHAPVFWGVWAGGLILAWQRWLRHLDTPTVNHLIGRINHWHSSHLSWWPNWLLLWALLAIACGMAFVPEIFYDSMVYHVGVPRWYLLEGGIHYYPSIHSQFPFLRQMLNVLGLALDGERLAKLLHGSSAVLIIATYHVLTRRYSFPKTTLIASLALFTMPMVNMNLWTAGIDIGLTAFSLLCFLAWVNGLTDTANRTRWFVLAGLFGGFCFASKYPGLITVASMCVTTLAWLGLAEKNWAAAIRMSVLLGILGLAGAAPWLIKSWVLTGNPLYPYLFHWFGGKDLLLDRVKDFTSDTGTGAKTNPLDLLMTPWTSTLTEVSSFSAPGVFLLGFLGFLILGVVRKDVRKNWYTASFIFFCLYWFCVNAMTDRIRLGIPGIAVGCFLLGHVAGTCYDRGSRFFKLSLALITLIAAGLGALSTIPTIYYSYAPWDVLLGRESADAYLSYTHPGMDPYPSTPMYVYAKNVVPPGHRLLIVGEEKVSPCRVPFLASGVHNDSLIVQWSRDSKTVDELAQKFKDHHVSHMMVNVSEAMRLSAYKVFNWDSRSLALFCAFSEQHLRIAHQEQIVERFFKKSSPILLYEFVETPITTAPSGNILLELYEEINAPSKDPQVAAKRRELLEALDHAYPGLVTVQQPLNYWRAQERLPHAAPK